jgi:hypothetical protein
LAIFFAKKPTTGTRDRTYFGIFSFVNFSWHHKTEDEPYLHSYDAIDEEDKADKNGNPRQGLEGLDEGPQKSSNCWRFKTFFSLSVTMRQNMS